MSSDVRPAEGVSPVRVLVVDECRMSRTLAERALTRAGFQVFAAESGAMVVEALSGPARLRRTAGLELPRFDVLVIDIDAPGLAGPETVRRIRGRGGQMPIVAFMGSELPEDQDECMRAGCAAFVTKPFRPELLVEACKLAMRRAS